MAQINRFFSCELFDLKIDLVSDENDFQDKLLLRSVDNFCDYIHSYFYSLDEDESVKNEDL